MFSTRIATQIYGKICFETTSGQKKIIEKLSEYLADSDFSKIFVLNGYAGTGKTTLVAALVGALKELGIKPVLLAPTGRAAKVLAQYADQSLWRDWLYSERMKHKVGFLVYKILSWTYRVR